MGDDVVGVTASPVAKFSFSGSAAFGASALLSDAWSRFYENISAQNKFGFDLIRI
jgi:hypothetical protein